MPAPAKIKSCSVTERSSSADERPVLPLVRDRAKLRHEYKPQREPQNGQHVAGPSVPPQVRFTAPCGYGSGPALPHAATSTLPHSCSGRTPAGAPGPAPPVSDMSDAPHGLHALCTTRLRRVPRSPPPCRQSARVPQHGCQQQSAVQGSLQHAAEHGNPRWPRAAEIDHAAVAAATSGRTLPPRAPKPPLPEQRVTSRQQQRQGGCSQMCTQEVGRPAAAPAPYAPPASPKPPQPAMLDANVQQPMPHNTGAARVLSRRMSFPSAGAHTLTITIPWCHKCASVRRINSQAAQHAARTCSAGPSAIHAASVAAAPHWSVACLPNHHSYRTRL